MSRILISLVLFSVAARGEEFRTEPEAEAVYARMLKTLRNAPCLYYESDYRSLFDGRESQRSRYKAWLKKPNRFRIEAMGQYGQGGTLVGDGEFLWIHWTDRRPRWNDEHYARWEETSKNVYLRSPTPGRAHSIAHQTPLLGADMGMAILNPSRFHGAPNSMDRYLDGVRALGAKTIDGEECTGIEVSFMNHQRSKYYWISKKDHLPRRLEQIVRVGRGDLVSRETWSHIRLDDDLPDRLFHWTPPEGWTEWRRPRSSEGILEPGAKAPAFRAKLLSGEQTALDDYRGKILWLVFWRVG